MITIIYSETQELLWYSETKHEDLEKISHPWTRNEFLQDFGVTWDERMVKMNYEPDRNLFIYALDSIDNPVRITDLKNSPFMEWLNQNIDLIRTKAIEYQYPNHILLNGHWVITAEKQAEIDLKNSREQLIFDRIREIAIRELKTEGKLPGDYK